MTSPQVQAWRDQQRARARQALLTTPMSPRAQALYEAQMLSRRVREATEAGATNLVAFQAQLMSKAIHRMVVLDQARNNAHLN